MALGAMAYSLYLWHWPLLIFYLAYTGSSRVNFIEGASVLLVSGVLAWLTTRYVEEPLRVRSSAAATGPVRAVPLWSRLRRPTIVLGSAVALLAVALTATSFTWREHVTVLRANGKELSVLSTRDYPGARALVENARVPQLPMRPTALEAKNDIPQSTVDGCISDFDNVGIINCTYGDQGGHPHHRAGRRLARRALDHRAGPARPAAPFQGRHLPEDGLPADHRGDAVGDGRTTIPIPSAGNGTTG